MRQIHSDERERAHGRALPQAGGDGRRLRALALAIRREMAPLVERGAATAELLDAFQRVLTQVQAEFAQARKGEGPAPACRAGCSSCCYQPVDVAWIEAVAIATALSGRADRNRLLAHATDYAAKLDAADAAGEAPPVAACPFLSVTGECEIYAVRPLVCRGYNSGDVGQCLEYAASGFRKRPTRFNKQQSDVGLAARAALALSVSAEPGGGGTVNLARGVLAAARDAEGPAAR